PHTDLPQFVEWRDETIRPGGATAEEQEERRGAASRAIEEYFVEAIESKRANPDARLLSKIVHGEFDGRPMTHAELLGACHLLLLGGLDTVTATLDCMITYLARHDDERRRLVANPDLIPSAVEELLRTETPVMVVPRVVRQPVTLAGVDLAPGDHV